MIVLNTVKPAPRARAALRGLDKVEFKGHLHRSPFLPTAFLYRHPHPLRHGRIPSPAPFDRQKLGGRTFVVFIDTSDEGREAEIRSWAQYKIPLGRAADIQRKYGAGIVMLFNCFTYNSILGLIQALPGDWILGRSIFSTGNPMDDVLLGMVCYDV